MAIVLTKKQRLMLVLLTQGASTEAIARQLKVVPGSARVSLCKLYRKIDVKNRIAAVDWYKRHYAALYFDPQSASYYLGEHDAEMPPASVLQPVQPIFSLGYQEFGHYALKNGLLTALGAIGAFIGTRTVLGEAESSDTPSRNSLRFLWECLLQGDLAAAHDNRRQPPPNGDEPCQEALSAMLLFLGGPLEQATYRVGKALKRHKVAPFSCAVLRALRDFKTADDASALLDLHRYVAELPPCHPAKHMAMVVLFHIYRLQGNMQHAITLANAIYAEAQGVQYLAAAQSGFWGVHASHSADSWG